ncbi:hypothetical protein [Lacisediminimonas sp.]|uniref:hypothetical protein n=1 Tax=Lacisediminimonas sp. TaxID=3060582 RepID=UPI002724787B|nr:hypothetical protein [Lacisediminimonas sp.]MDO8300117.1 hypothetical protein [Lacisediminimonas sp.]
MRGITKIIAIAIAILASTLWASSASALTPQQTRECQQKLPPAYVKVQFIPARPEVKTLPGKQLAQTVKQASETTFNGAIAGWTDGLLEVTVDISAEQWLLSPTELCFSPMVSVDLSFRVMNVFVASELTQDPCAYHYVVDHEMTHVVFNNEAMEKAAEELRRALLRRQFENQGPIATTPQGLNMAIRQMKSSIATSAHRIFSQHNNQHGLIDNHAMRAKSLAVCNAAIPGLLNGEPKPPG